MIKPCGRDARLAQGSARASAFGSARGGGGLKVGRAEVGHVPVVCGLSLMTDHGKPRDMKRHVARSVTTPNIRMYTRAHPPLVAMPVKYTKDPCLPSHLPAPNIRELDVHSLSARQRRTCMHAPFGRWLARGCALAITPSQMPPPRIPHVHVSHPHLRVCTGSGTADSHGHGR